MIGEPRADARDMFVVHAMFRLEFGLMPGLIRAGRYLDDRSFDPFWECAHGLGVSAIRRPVVVGLLPKVADGSILEA